MERRKKVSIFIYFIIFIRFPLFPDRRQMCWRRKNERMAPQNIQGRVQQGGGGLMVHGTMAADGVRSLIRIDGVLTGDEYIKQVC